MKVEPAKIIRLDSKTPRPSEGQKISPQHVSKLGFIELEALVEQLHARMVYDAQETRTIKEELVKITSHEIYQKAVDVSPFDELRIRRLDREIDQIWNQLGHPIPPGSDPK